MRPHVETVQNTDLMWHPAELPRGSGDVWQRNLSYDEEVGSASTELLFRSSWSRSAGYHHADTEWFVRTGQIKVGDKVFGKGAYMRVPAGLHTPALDVQEGTEVLLFREYGDFGFSVADDNWDREVLQGGNTSSDATGEMTLLHSREDAQWTPNIYEGDSQRFLHLKVLFHDPSPEGDHTKGFVSILAWAPPGWREHRLAHHPVFEEAFCLWGSMDYNFGHIQTGTYFFRPAKVKHGNFDAHREKGACWIFRLDGDLVNWITSGSEVIVKGNAKNYDPHDPVQAPEIAGIPVRSKTTGLWDGYGR